MLRTVRDGSNGKNSVWTPRASPKAKPNYMPRALFSFRFSDWDLSLSMFSRSIFSEDNSCRRNYRSESLSGITEKFTRSFLWKPISSLFR